MKVSVSSVLVASVLIAGCSLITGSWPDRTGRTPEVMLTDVVRWQQQTHVRTSVGELDYECFTWVNLHAFFDRGEHTQIAQRLRKAPDFAEIVRALESLPPDRLRSALLAASSVARPTWATMGYIDREGNGQTEAGHIADLMVAGTIVESFAEALNVEAPKPRDNWRMPGPKSWPTN